MGERFSIPLSFPATISIEESRKTSSTDCWATAQTPSNQYSHASSTPSAREIANCSTNSIAWSRRRRESWDEINVRVPRNHPGPCFTVDHQRDGDIGGRRLWTALQTAAPQVFRTHAR